MVYSHSSCHNVRKPKESAFRPLLQPGDAESLSLLSRVGRAVVDIQSRVFFFGASAAILGHDGDDGDDDADDDEAEEDCQSTPFHRFSGHFSGT